jgi:magnesium chelatase subunit I
MTLQLVQELQIPSHRAEIALLEAARARAAADFRGKVITEDIQRLAPLALRQRRSSVLEAYAATIVQEDTAITQLLEYLVADRPDSDPADEAAAPDGDRGGERPSMVREIEKDIL